MEKFVTFDEKPISNLEKNFQQKRPSKTLPYSVAKFDALEIMLPPLSLLKPETTNECDFDEPDLGIGNTSGNKKKKFF